MSSTIVAVEGLTKKYGKKQVFSNLSFSIEEGKIIGLLGQNGIGKTSLLRILSGLLQPSGGNIKYRSTKTIAVSPEISYFPKWMTVRDSINYYQDFFIYFEKDRAECLCSDSEIELDEKLHKLSRGNQEKVCLFLTLSRKVSLYLLDEPFGGIDPSYKRELKTSLLSNIDERSTILIATHLLLDLETILDEVMILKNDKIISDNLESIRECKGKSLEDYYMEVICND